ncbi:hypothetical protein SDC9_187195 [bioreactor metagenome]|uniref:Uncharacterized protein n=1 Tax=bioreactor metagenome TaxID=1076179 RepID=A0A645HL03_9ZZZZ
MDEGDLVNVVQGVFQAALLDRDEVHGHPDADAVRLDHRVDRRNRDDHTDDEEEEELVDAVGEESDDEAGDHFLSPGLVVEFSREVAAEGRSRHGHGEAEHQP